MELKDAAIKSLTELCKIGDTNNREKNTFQVTIPYYQRPYKWDAAKITTLFSDFFKSKEEKCEEYFVGSVVMVEKDNNKSNICPLHRKCIPDPSGYNEYPEDNVPLP